MLKKGEKNASYQKRFRDQLKAKGYVKRECWIPQEFSNDLKLIEKALRKGLVPIIPTVERKNIMTIRRYPSRPRTTQSLFTELNSLENNDLNFEIVNETIKATSDITEDFPCFISVSGGQILVMANIVAVNDVAENKRPILNETMLRLNTFVPLSDFAIVNNTYVLFGALSVNSGLNEIIEEIETLSSNIIDAVETITDIIN